MTSAEKIAEEAVNGASDQEQESPRPLMRELPPATPFPVNALGELLGNAAKAIQDKIQVPIAISGQSVLAAAALAVQGHADIELPTGQSKPVSIYLMTIAESGDRKTASDEEALRPIRDKEKALRAQYNIDLAAYMNEKMAWDKARAHAVNKLKIKDKDGIKEVLDEVGEEPKLPLEPMLICHEPTFEGLAKLYSIGLPSLGIFSNEGGQFIGGHGMKEDNKLRTATGISSVWDGEVIKRVRATDGIFSLPGKRLTIHLMAQRDVATIILSDSLLLSQGLLSRFLVTAPDSIAGTRFWKEPNASSKKHLDVYSRHILKLLNMKLPLVDDKTVELNPRKLPLSREAKKIWTDFVDYIEKAICPNGDLEPVRGLANKLPEHAARIAGVLTLVENITAPEISGEKMAVGIELAKHYVNEALRLFGASRIHQNLLLAKKLLEWLHTSWHEPLISLPDIYQLCPINSIRDQATALKIVDILVEHAHLQRVDGGDIVNGKKRRDVWQIIKR